jgi:hypothetical protein
MQQIPCSIAAFALQVVRVSGHMTCAEYTIDVTASSSSTSGSSISDTVGSSSGSGSSSSSTVAAPEAWTVLRRYSDFKDLHVALPSAVSGLLSVCYLLCTAQHIDSCAIASTMRMLV